MTNEQRNSLFMESYYDSYFTEKKTKTKSAEALNWTMLLPTSFLLEISLNIILRIIKRWP